MLSTASAICLHLDPACLQAAGAELSTDQGCILSPCLFNIYAESIMDNAGLDEAQAGIKMLGEISITSNIQMTPHSWQKVKKN